MMKKKKIFKQNFSEIKEPETSKLGIALRTIVSQKGTMIYTNIDELSILLEEQKIDSIQIKQVEMVLISGAFSRYLDQISEGISVLDINNIINATMYSGLSLETIKTVVSDLLYGLGISQKVKIRNLPDIMTTEVPQENTYITPYTCKSELNRIENLIKKGTKLSEEQFSYLNYCYESGIPKAARLLGILYQQGGDLEKDLKKSVEYLNSASRMGDAESRGLLGDYHFREGRLDEAYSLYTMPGALAVNEQRRGIVRILCEIKKFNLKSIIMWFLIAVLMEGGILFSSSAITGDHILAKIVCTVVNIGTIVSLIWVNRKKPFFDLRIYGVAFSIIFFIYMFVYILV